MSMVWLASAAKLAMAVSTNPKFFTSGMYSGWGYASKNSYECTLLATQNTLQGGHLLD